MTSKRLQETSWDEINKLVHSIVTQIKDSGRNVYKIVAIRKGGIIPAGILLQYFPGASFHTINVISYHGADKKQPAIIDGIPPEFNNPNTLVVDEICDSGDTFRLVQGHLPLAMYAALHVRDECNFNPEFWGSIVQLGKWVCYPWEPSSDELEIPF